MKTKFHTLAVLTATALCGTAAGQQWEVGGNAGGGFYLSNSISGARGTGNAGFKPGLVVGGWLGHNPAGRFGGEIRYLFATNPLKVSSGGSQYDFSGRSHMVSYDFIYHTRSSEDVVRPFIAVGGGLKGYVGTGTERAVQPLSNIAILSRTTQWQPVLNFGGGVKWLVGTRMVLRAEVRNYVTPFPKDVLLPAPGNKVSGWVHNITPLFGISYLLD